MWEPLVRFLLLTGADMAGRGLGPASGRISWIQLDLFFLWDVNTERCAGEHCFDGAEG